MKTWSLLPVNIKEAVFIGIQAISSSDFYGCYFEMLTRMYKVKDARKNEINTDRLQLIPERQGLPPLLVLQALH